MEATELRKGNIIRPKNPIHSHEIVVSIDGDWVNNMPADNFTGIPLTEEWLMKFGFGEDNQFIFDIHRPIYISINQDGHSYTFMKKQIEIRYVHQLQNLYFWLTGEELL